LVIGPIENPQVNYPIEVTVENLLDGTVQIEAFDPNTGVELNKTFGEDTQVGSTTLPQQKMLIRDAVINML
jgi:molecular chaperone DnaK